MDRIIAYCGLVCSDCPAYTATQADDRAALERLCAANLVANLGTTAAYIVAFL